MTTFVFSFFFFYFTYQGYTNMNKFTYVEVEMYEIVPKTCNFNNKLVFPISSSQSVQEVVNCQVMQQSASFSICIISP